MRARLDPPAIVRPADRFEVLRCRCSICVGLDFRYPDEGFQLSLLAFRRAA